MEDAAKKRVSYFPGCSCHGTGIEYDLSSRDVCAALGVELAELEDWNCCGTSSAHAVEARLSIALCARNFRLARDQGQETVVTPCAACFSRLKHAAVHIRDHGAPEGMPDLVEAPEVLHLLDVLTLPEVLEAMESWPGRRPLSGLKAVCYYGCLTVRPPGVTGAPCPENPTTMDRLLTLMGAEVLAWPSKTECCGSSLSLTRSDLVVSAVTGIAEMAARAGAEVMVTACPLCFVNVDTRQAGPRPVPVMYFTELMAFYLGLPAARRTLWRHQVSPTSALRARGVV